MPTDSAARGCSPTARSRSPAGVRNSTRLITTTSSSISQIMRFILPMMSPR